MADQSHLDDSEHWRARAKEVRALADQGSYLPATDQVLRVAPEDEHLAERPEPRPHSSSSESTAVGVSDCVCEVPAGWNAIAETNSLAMEEDGATRKSLYSGLPSRIED